MMWERVNMKYQMANQLVHNLELLTLLKLSFICYVTIYYIHHLYMFDKSFDPNKTILDWPIDIEVYIF